MQLDRGIRRRERERRLNREWDPSPVGHCKDTGFYSE